MAFIWLPLLIFAAVTAAEDISLSLQDPPYEKAINIDKFESKKFKLTVVEEAQVLVEFVPKKRKVGEERGTKEREQGPPDLLLSVVEGEDTKVFETEGTNQGLNGDDSKYGNFDCTESFPCLKNASNISVDDESFYSFDERAFIMRTVDGKKPLHITLTNFDRLWCFRIDNAKVCLKPKLEGQLRITLADKDNKDLCPGYEPEGKKFCGGHGKCEEGKCKCDEGFIGRDCMNVMHDMREELPEPAPKKPKGGWLTDEFEDGTVVHVNPFSLRVFNWTQARGTSRVHIKGKILAGRGYGSNSNEEVMYETDLFRPAWTTDGRDQRVYPSSFKRSFLELCDYGRRGFDPYISFSCLTPEIETDETVRLMMYGDARLSRDDPLRAVVVNFVFERCGVDNTPKCPSFFFISIPAAVLPVCIATILITGMAIITMLWLDRRHGFTRAVDRLNEKELERMYPGKKFRAAMLEGSETSECLICISEFEQGEVVRILHCKHVFHSECLDNNASCPACRAELRIKDLSDKKRMRRVVRFFLAPVVWIRERRQRRRDEEESNPPNVEHAEGGVDVEAGLQPGHSTSAQMRSETPDEQEEQALTQQHQIASSET